MGECVSMSSLVYFCWDVSIFQAIRHSALSPEVALAAASKMAFHGFNHPSSSSTASSSNSEPNPSSDASDSDTVNVDDDDDDDIPLALAEASGHYQGLPDLGELLLDRSEATAQMIAHTIQHLQFIIVHNNMDFASVDMRRRSQCACLTATQATKLGFASSCTGCI